MSTSSCLERLASCRRPRDAAGYLGFGLKVEPPPAVRAYHRTYQLGSLIDVTQKIDEGEKVEHDLLEALHPGTSLGGARPKATIEDSNVLYLAKFPAREDRVNWQRIEFATLTLAARAGIHTARPRLERVGMQDVSIEGRDLALTVGKFGRAAAVYNLMSDFARFALGEKGARGVIHEVVAAVRRWRDVYLAGAFPLRTATRSHPRFYVTGSSLKPRPSADHPGDRHR